MLFWVETEKLLKKYQVRLANSIPFEHISELSSRRIPFPCALKTDDPKIYHRLEKNAVMLNIRDKKELELTYVRMNKSTGAKHFLIQPIATAGLEMIIGMKRDSAFGPVILCGLGGSFTEIFRDKIILIPPIDFSYIGREILKLKIYPLLKGFRGKKGYDINEISNAIKAISDIALDYPQINEIDVNPLVVYNDGTKAQILDAKIFIK
jgi:acetyl-CoA synthetase (ADP-forming)